MLRRSVLIVEDHAAYRSGLCRLIDDSETFRVVGETGDCHEAVRLAALHRPDVTVIDADLSGAAGPCVARVLRGQRPGAAVVLLSMEFDHERLIEAMRAGVSGYLAKETNGQALVSALARVLAGESLFRDVIQESPSLASRVLAEFRAMPAMSGIMTDGSLQPLSAEEIEVLEGISLAGQEGRIAAPVARSGFVITDHIGAILRKLDANDRAETMRFAARHGWSMGNPAVPRLGVVSGTTARRNVSVVGTASASARW